MIKKITISMMICVTLFLSVQQSYVKASSSIASNSAEVLRGAWQSVVMGIAAAGAAGLQTKQIIDDNRDALVAKANAAWDKMSVESQRVFGEALDAGRLGASQTYNELYGAIEGVFDDVYGSKVTTTTPYTVSTLNGEVSFAADSNHRFKIFQFKPNSPNNISTYTTQYLNVSATPYTDYVTVYFGTKKFRVMFPGNIDKAITRAYADAISNVRSVGALSSLMVSRTFSPICDAYGGCEGYGLSALQYVKSDGTIVQESIYDQALKRAKEQDIPKMRDAGLVLPEPTITGAQGQKLRYDAQTGTLVLPDGSIYTGDASWSYPKPTIGVNKNPVWQDTATGQDTDIWTGDKTDTITGNPAIPDTGVGEGTDSPTITTKLDKILEGVRAIPDAIVTGITTIFVPTATPTAFSNMIKQFTGLLVLPSFAWLTNSDLACSRVQDVKVTIMGKSLTIVSLDFVMQAKTFYMPIMRGFLWFLFGWYAYKKIIAMINKVDGVSQ